MLEKLNVVFLTCKCHHDYLRSTVSVKANVEVHLFTRMLFQERLSWNSGIERLCRPADHPKILVQFHRHLVYWATLSIVTFWQLQGVYGASLINYGHTVTKEPTYNTIIMAKLIILPFVNNVFVLFELFWENVQCK